MTGKTPPQQQLSKLDGVIYHFYAKTSSIITSSRLTHFDFDTEGTVPPTQPSGAGQQPNTGTVRKRGKWVSFVVQH